MSDKTQLWDRLGRTDPAHTKQFKRGGGFSGTAIKPMWSYRRMTEEFGPVGQGWGIYAPSFEVVPGTDGETLVFCTVSIWYEKPDQISWGVGGDKVVAKFSSGMKSDDEAFKKAFTDAITNALKMIGVGADVHMGMFDDSKYVNAVGQEFAQEKEQVTKSSAQLKREGEWERVTKSIAENMIDVHTFAAFEKLKASYRVEATKNGWNRTFLEQLADHFAGLEDRLAREVEKDNLLLAGE